MVTLELGRLSLRVKFALRVEAMITVAAHS